MKIKVIFEDSDTLVINKPVGMVVNRAETTREETIQDWVEKRIMTEPDKWQTNDSLFKSRSGICHRLDKETGGCLMIAKSPAALNYYLRLFKEREVKKSYEALVHGRVEPDHGEVILPLKRSLFDRERWQVHYEGKRAVTEWQVEQRYVLPDSPHWQNALTLLSINLKTGRTHQIRVHLSHLGWPIFADEKYLNKEQAQRDRELLPHHFLHARWLEFVTLGGEAVKVEALLPDDAIQLLSKLMLE